MGRHSGIIPSVYPNPFHDRLLIACPQKLSVQVSDVLGKILFDKVIVGEAEIDLSGSPPGFYFIRFAGKKHLTVVKAVKH
jgi:hypothetical protein